MQWGPRITEFERVDSNTLLTTARFDFPSDAEGLVGWEQHRTYDEAGLLREIVERRSIPSSAMGRTVTEFHY